MNDTIRPRGRPLVYLTEEDREAARQKARKRSKAKYRNITVDEDIGALLQDACDRLEAQLGFRPNVSQVIRYLLKKGAQS